ncbi:MAG: thioredoxin fold domain-containing protein [Thermomonas sp.]|uniref:DsbC family protein n=1 Tax=Thermomonas sp. TaxID=1971895 RepID=UPI0039E5BEA0
MKRFILAALCGISLSACAQPASAPPANEPKPAVAPASPKAKLNFAAGTPEARAQAGLLALNPRIEIESIGPAPIPGFREAVVTGQVVYVSDDGKYLFKGGLLDLVGRRDLAEDAMAKVRKQVLAGIPVEDRIVFKTPGTPKYKVIVLTDIECGFCRKFHEDIAQYTGRGIQVEYMAFPRNGIGSPDYHAMVSVWCAENRNKALTDAKSGRRVPTRTCARSPVDMQYRAGVRMGLTGTPMLLAEDGSLLGGYLTPVQLQQLLEARAAKPASGS